MTEVKRGKVKQQIKTPSPTKLATVTSLAKKTYGESFTKVNCQIHPSVIPFLTPMNVKETYNEQLSNAKILQPYVAPVNHNAVTSAKTLQIVHTLMGNYCHGDQIKKVSSRIWVTMHVYLWDIMTR